MTECLSCTHMNKSIILSHVLVSSYRLKGQRCETPDLYYVLKGLSQAATLLANYVVAPSAECSTEPYSARNCNCCVGGMIKTKMLHMWWNQLTSLPIKVAKICWHALCEFVFYTWYWTGWSCKETIRINQWYISSLLKSGCSDLIKCFQILFIYSTDCYYFKTGLANSQ